MTEEGDRQKAILIFLESQRIFAWPVKNMGTYDAAKGIHRRPPAGFVPGVPDVCAIPFDDGVTWYFEVKSAKGRPSKDQLTFHAKLRARGVPVFVVKTVDDVMEALASSRRERG